MQFFYIALAIVIVGNGFFMPNISSVLGHIYAENDSRREGGFSILYSAVNMGAFIPPLISASIISLLGWHTAFFVAGVGTLFSVVIFYFYIYRHSILPHVKKTMYFSIAIGLVCTVFLIDALVKHTQIVNGVLYSLGSVLVLKTVKSSFCFSTHTRNRVLACLLLTAFTILFCVLCEQAAMSLTIYTEYNVDRSWRHWLIPTVSFLALNPFFIITCGPLASKLWIKLDAKNLNPSIPVKFALGTLLVGLGFIILPLAISMQSSEGQINLGWIILSYFLQSLGELLVYPVGLSMMTALSPKQMVGLMIGVWYFATAIANALAGVASALTVIPSGSTAALATSHAYSMVSGVLGWSAIAAGVVLLGFVRPIKRLIEGK